jgi:hypothetical protein
LLGVHTAEKAGFFMQDKEAFKQMLILTSLRGIHSTGVFGTSRHVGNKDVNLVKTIGSPYYFFEYSKTDEFFSRMVNSFGTVVGHCRYATRGEVNADNAHPFEEGHITLAHNGMISNYFHLRDGEKHKDIEVDSHLVARLFEEEGAENILPKLEGAYTLMWWDSRDDSLNIARNSQRPLYGTEMANKNTLIFASEHATLSWNAARNDMKCEAIIEVPAMNHLKFLKGSIEADITPYTYKPRPIISWPTKEKETAPHYKLKRKTQRSKTGEADFADLDMLSETHRSNSLELQTQVDFEVHDWQQKQGYIIVTGRSEHYPNVEFHATGVNLLEDELYECDSIRGNISSIVMVDPENTESKVRWRVFITNFVLRFSNKEKLIDSLHANEADVLQQEQDADVGEKMFKIPSFNGGYELLTDAGIRKLAAPGCGWCTEHVYEADLRHPEKCMIYEHDGTAEFICSSCASGIIEDNARDIPKDTKEETVH